jgi:ATP synthase F0 subunit b
VLSINMGLVWTIINLIVLFLLLRHFLINPVSNIMEQRRKLIADGLQNAQDTQDEANRLKAEYEEALSGAKKESAEIVDKARIDARAEYDRIVGEAGAKAGNIIENAKENVRIEREQTMKELQSQIAGLAIASAEKIVGDKEQNIYDQFLGEVGGTDEDTDK